MKKKKGSGLISNTCIVCGKTFYSKHYAKYCTDNSTCRVKAHQARREQDKIAKSLMMNMDTYKSYAWFVERYPDLKEKFDALIFDLGVEKFDRVLNLMTWVLLEQNKRIDNAVYPS